MRPAETGTAIVRGRVVAADTGLPVRRAIVSLRNVRQEERGRSTTTAPDGTFAFEAVPSGRYRLGASKSRYVETALGARAPGRPGRAFDLGNGQKIEGVTITLALAGVIAGRVVDDAGEPVSGANVVALQRRTPDGALRGVPSVYARSDDTGAYRLFGLAPGRYFVAASPDESLGRAHDLLDVSGSAFARTYYPSTPLLSEAQPLDVAVGAETFADIALVTTRVTTVSGEVVDVAGRPAMAGMIVLSPKGERADPGAHPSAMGVVRAGAFSVSGVPPGDYELFVQAFFDEGELMRMAGSGSFEDRGFTMPLPVSGAPIEGLRIVVPPSVEVVGRVLFEGDQPRSPTINILASRDTGERGGTHTTVGADGRFTLRVRPGAWRIMPWMPSGWMLKRATFRGRVVDDPFAAIDIDAEPGARLDLLMTSQVTLVTGTASDADGRPHVDYHAVIFPAQSKGKEALVAFGFPRIERADAQGRFRVEAVPPGEYLVAAIADYDPQEPLDEEFVEALRPAATPIRLGEGETETVALKLVALP
jgi:hypothetical protein